MPVTPYYKNINMQLLLIFLDRLKTINNNFIAIYLEFQQYWLLMLIVNIIHLGLGHLIVFAK